jgi:hypothetical protein
MMEPIRLWRFVGHYAPSAWAEGLPAYGNPVEYAALTRADFDALVKQRDEARRLATVAGVCEIAAHNPNVASYCREWEARAEKAEAQRDAYISGREMQRDRADAATARADALAALLKEARGYVTYGIGEGDPHGIGAAMLARIDAALEVKK